MLTFCKKKSLNNKINNILLIANPLILCILENIMRY